MRVPPGADREFTASAYVVDAGRVLMIRHTKLGRWVQPGGHIEGVETPDEAATREVREETGIVITIDSDHRSPRSNESQTVTLPVPFVVNVHEVRLDHWHVDFAYLASVERRSPDHDTDEHDGQRWLSIDDIASLAPIDDNTRYTARRAIQSTIQ